MVRPKNISPQSGRPIKLLFALAVAGASFYIFISIASYRATDPTWRFATATDAAVANLGGSLGAVLADLLFLFLGWAALLVPLAMLLFGVQMLALRRISVPWLKGIANILGFLVVIAGVCILAEIHLEAPIPVIATRGGGMAGLEVLLLAQTHLPIEVTISLAVLMVVAGLQMLQGFNWLWICEHIGGAAVRCTSLGARASDQRREQDIAELSTPLSLEANAMNDEVRRPHERPVHREFERDASHLTASRNLSVEAPKPVPKGEELTAQTSSSPSKRKAKSSKDRITPSFGCSQALNRKRLDKRSSSNRKLRASQRRTTGIPTLELLDEPDQDLQGAYTENDLRLMSEVLTEKLGDFGVEATVATIQPGPVVTRFEVQPAPGTKVSKFTALAKDLARALMVSSVRIVEIIPGRSTIGIEIPNQTREIVRLSEILSTDEYSKSTSPLTLALGKDVSGRPVYADVSRMPHLLVAGTTGSGKSVAINAILISLLFKSTPEQVKLILIDPKMLELSVYEGIPHLLTPVVTDMQEAGQALHWCVAEMDRRYRLMASIGVRNLEGYNQRILHGRERGQPLRDPFWDGADQSHATELDTLPLIVVVIDEFADMMMIVGKKIDQTIARIAQKARAAGIHLVLATQRPSVDVITGLIKANINCRIGFLVPTKVDSRTILDQGGAEQLLGYGDMLYMSPGSGIPERVHGAFVSDEEVHRVVAAWKTQGEPEYLQLSNTLDFSSPSGIATDGDAEQDEYYGEAVAFVMERGSVSISSIQRRFKIGYNRAANLVEAMESAGLVSPPGHNGTREVFAPETV